MEMDQKIARRLFEEGGTCICLGLPPGSEFGIDLKSFTTGDKFNGVKMIPPGLHFIYYSTENDYGDQSPRVGFLHSFGKSEVVVKKWDSQEEELVDEKNEETIQRIKSDIKTLDKNLGPYPFDIWSRWKNLSNKISDKLVTKVVPLCGRIHSVLLLKAVKDDKIEKLVASTSTSRRSRSKFFCEEKNDEILPNLEADEEKKLRFSTIPDKSYPENCPPSEITKYSLDSSYLFQQILSQHDNFSDILGEIQLSFICFLIGFSFEAFDHWKKLIGILCSCDEALPRHLEIFSDFMTLLNCQLQEVQEDFLVDIVAGNNFVYKMLRVFFRNLHCSDVNGRLKTKAKRFQELLTEKLCWDFNDIFEEDEEDLPVIVETE